MKIAVTYEDGQIFQHFGHTQQFKVYDIQDNKVVSSRIVDTMGQGHGALAMFLMIKDSSLISCIGAVELLKGAQIIGAQYFDVMSPYMLAAIFYLVMTCVVSMIGMKVEKRLSVSD